jgi:hypothetical protein
MLLSAIITSRVQCKIKYINNISSERLESKVVRHAGKMILHTFAMMKGKVVPVLN